MDFQALLKGMDCQCGRRHDCGIAFVAVEHEALRHLEELCKDYHAVLLVADENTYAVAGAKTMGYLAGKRVDQVIFSGSKVLIPNEEAIQRVSQALPGHDLILGIGSGVIQDLCKYTAFQGGVAYYIVATAPSMDGYASSGAAMITGGLKVTYRAKVPAAILADTDILKNAPFEMIQAGYGDIIGKFSALNDWKLSHVVNGEYFCHAIYDLTMDALRKTLELAGGLVCREEESIGILMEALILVGIAMSFAGSSRPASGSEHHLSHFFEIVGIVWDKPYLSHGIDVACSTVLTAKLRQKILNSPFEKKRDAAFNARYELQMQRIYGAVAPGCMELQRKTGFYDQSRLEIYQEKESQIRQILREMPSAQEIEEMLKRVGLSMETFYRVYSRDTLADAIRYAKDLKDRYTVLWLYYDLFGDTQKEMI